MARIGELLVAAGRLTPAQLDEGLRAQVLYGGRLGTNLIELFHLELDHVAMALARQHGVPAALERHFERCDVTVQQRLPAEVADRLSVVPIGRLADRRERIAIASCDPLTYDALAELAHHLRVAADALVVSIAAELRVRYYLERAYRIARPSRYLRVRRETQREIPIPPLDDLESSDVDQSVDIDLDDDAGTTVRTPTGQIPHRAPPRARTEDEPTASREFASSRLLDETPEPPEIEIDPEVQEVLAQNVQRRFVRTLGEADVHADAGAEPDPAAADAAAAPVPAEAFTDQTPFARIAIRRVSPPARDGGPELTKVDDATRAIRRSGTREKVGDLVIRAAMQLGGPRIDAAVLFVARDPIAIGWKGEVRDADPAIDEIAVPLDESNAIANAFRGGGLVRLALSGAVTALDRRLLAALGGAAPSHVTVAPVAIAGQAVCLLYAHGPADVGDLLAALAEAASTAFVRLLRQAQR
jgi:hypothetical protein